MGIRGPKPVDVAALTLWEFEWYKAFHLLRDGTQVPARDEPPPPMRRSEAWTLLRWLQKATPEKYWSWLEQQAGEPLRQPRHVELHWAELDRDLRIRDLQHYLNPRRILAQAERREIWNALIRAHTVQAVQQACQGWERLPDVRAMGFTPFPAHVVANAKEFLRMKRNRRFPRSAYADDSRLEYLARGMAGVMVGVSPMTAIERLRNMKHAPGGPCWSEKSGRCGCWRCWQTELRKIDQLLWKEQK